MLAISVIAAAGIGEFWSVRLAIANWCEKRNDLRSVLYAIKLAPGNEAYLRRAAELTDETGADGTVYRRKAIAADPYCSTNWIQLAFRAEREGRYREAEENLLEAARVDRLFEPRWALANLYFRAADTTNSLRWIREVLEIAQGDLTPVFRLAWQTTADASLILSNAIPDRSTVLAAYLDFLSSSDRLNEATPVAMKLARIANPSQVGAVQNYCERMLGSGHANEATAVWNQMLHRRFISEPLIGSDPAHLLLNGNFRRRSSEPGFHWRIPVPDGVSTDGGGPDGLRIEFSGKEPDRFVILSQYLQLAPNTKYRIHATYQASGIESGQELSWRVFDLSRKTDVANASFNLVPERQGEVVANFTTPSNTGLVSFQLAYERPAGVTHIEGILRLTLVDVAIQS